MKSKLLYANCSGCSLIDEPLVSPYGNGQDYIAIVGEAPGLEEVKIGRPFVGRSGQLLRRIMSEVGIEVERVYYTNAVLCRPPSNRDPSTAEIRCCHDRLLHELAEVKPKVIVPLGGFAHQAITGRAGRIKKARGKAEYIDIGDYRCVVLSSIHPAALLRLPDDFPDLCEDLKRAVDICNGDDVFIEPPIDNYIIIMADDIKRMDALLRRIEKLAASLSPEDIISVDLETDGLQYLGKEIITCALSWKRETAVAFDWDLIRQHSEFRARLNGVLSVMPCSFHSGMFDIPWLNQEGIYPNFQWCTMLASYTLDERKGVHDLERLAVSRYKAPTYKMGEAIKDVKSIDRRKLLIYNATDADYTRRLADDLIDEMDDKDVGVMTELLIPAAVHFTKQFETGMLVDRDHLEANGVRWNEEIKQIEEQLRSFPGASDVNPNSPRQVASYLYDKLGLRQMAGGTLDTIDKITLLDEIRDVEDSEAQEYWHTQSVHAFDDISARSTATYMLFWLAQQHDYPRLMVKHRLLGKKYGTYYKGLRDVIWTDGRIRPSVKLHGTVTGRQSSSDPNLHGTPRDPTIKDTYIADDGFLILYGDYPQAEIRMLAHFAKDDNLIRAISEQDIHTMIAKQLYGLSDKQWVALAPLDREIKRRAAKTIVFGTIYGRGAKGLAPQLRVSVEEAQYLVDRLYSIMPGGRQWINKMKMQVLMTHEVQSLYGRKRRFSLIADKKQRAEVQRQAVNMPIQSSVSDMTFRAYYQTCQEFDDMHIEFKRWAQIHDAFMILVRKQDVRKAGAVMKDVMENHLDFETNVSFGPVEIRHGKSLGNLKELVI